MNVPQVVPITFPTLTVVWNVFVSGNVERLQITDSILVSRLMVHLSLIASDNTWQKVITFFFVMLDVG